MEFQSAEHIHLFAEAERRVYADRATHLGDPDFVKVPVDTLISEAYNTRRMSTFNSHHADQSDSIQAGIIKESEETTHFSIIDSEGNAVSLTTTINTGYGCKVWVNGAGFILNNEMDDFSAKPGVPNFFGLVGNEANSIAAGKRMLSSMCPTIVVEDGKTKLIVGTPGGSTIITSVFQVITAILDFNLNVDEATQSCRFHHQWLPDQIFVEEGICLADSTTRRLIEMGHIVKERSPIGKVETIHISGNKIHVAADRRGDDSASGF
jgi:gamma-glutamyltranspeptidase/glutathione hydrolase